MNEPAELPLLMAGPLVVKTLADLKTNTRRICREQPKPWLGYHLEAAGDPKAWKPMQYEDGTWDLFCGFAETHVKGFGRCPFGKPGDRLWVRETWADVNTGDGPAIAYRADKALRTWHDWCVETGPNYGAGPSMNYEKYPGNYAMWWEDLFRDAPGHNWRPSIFMPRWACRLRLEVTAVRIERLSEITTADIEAEGITVPPVDYSVNDRPDFLDAERDAWARAEFAKLWDGINGKRPGCSWADDPWVWVVAFRRLP